MIKESIKKWIDEADYEILLRKWRFTESGNPLFQDETGEYYSKVMFAKRDLLSSDEQAIISKLIGWEKT